MSLWVIGMSLWGVVAVIVGAFLFLALGLLIGGMCNVASKADERMEARIRDEWQ